MTDPEEAVRRARRAAARAVAEGGYREPPLSVDISPAAPLDTEQLARWAVIEVDPETLVSTRRLGRPLTLVKRGLVRFLRQYNEQVLAQQIRFNAHVSVQLQSIDRRLRAVEEKLGAGPNEHGRSGP